MVKLDEMRDTQQVAVFSQSPHDAECRIPFAEYFNGFQDWIRSRLWAFWEPRLKCFYRGAGGINLQYFLSVFSDIVIYSFDHLLYSLLEILLWK